MEDPISIRPGVAIPLREVAVRASRSSGPGGQHRNKVETGVRLTHRPSGTVVTLTVPYQPLPRNGGNP